MDTCTSVHAESTHMHVPILCTTGASANAWHFDHMVDTICHWNCSNAVIYFPTKCDESITKRWCTWFIVLKMFSHIHYSWP